ncbi:MAG: hypothetical protein NVS3B19_00800 [Ginsengibacter sp.]
MALPQLIKFIYNSGSDEVIRRGKKIHGLGYVELLDHDDLMNTINFRVKDDSYSTFYRVNIQKYNDPKTITLRCSCPYNLSDICRHEAAALFQLQDLVDRKIFGDQNIVKYNQKHTVIKMKFIDLKMIRLFSSPSIYAEAESITQSNIVNITSSEQEKVVATLDLKNKVYNIVIQKNDEKNFDTSCNCNETDHALCPHKTALFLQLLNTYGPLF